MSNIENIKKKYERRDKKKKRKMKVDGSKVKNLLKIIIDK